VTTRFRLAWVLAACALAGCGDDFNAGPIPFAKSDELGKQLEGKPRLQAEVTKALQALYGASPKQIRVPKGAPLPLGGAYLASQFRVEDQPNRIERAKYHDSATGEDRPLEGGYALYRKHCLHCHGVSGDGQGPTAEFLWPRPRDFRRGVFKFTSTTGNKPTRADLRKTLVQGIPNSAMPSFESLMTPAELEQVLDFTIFLSLRGETERALINEASVLEEADAATAFTPDIISGINSMIFDQWRAAEGEVLNPPVPRTPSSPASIAQGKQLFLGLTTEKLQCAGCHGYKAYGDGPSFVPKRVFDDVVFGGDPETMTERLEKYDEATRKLWVEGSLDDWGNPLRPANLNNGTATMYKGGRRPIDLYWRIAKGINGAKMPAHLTALKPEQIWDLVNFVLALPYEPELLKDVPTTPPPPATLATR
jgi:mono/diheme cytochrome c family protein